jgi:hypothetical protein
MAKRSKKKFMEITNLKHPARPESTCLPNRTFSLKDLPRELEIFGGKRGLNSRK